MKIIGFKKRLKPVAKKEKDRLKKREIFGLLLGVFSVISIFLASLGYGVVLSADTNFSIPHETLFNSPFDLVEISVWAITHIIDLGNKSPDAFHMLIKVLSYIALPVSLVFLLILIVFFVIKKNRGFFEKKKTPPRWLVEAKRSISLNDSYLLGAVKIFVVFVLFLIGYSSLIVVFIIGIPAIVALSTLVSLAGLDAGNSYIEQYVIKPAACSPLINRDERIRQINMRAAMKKEGKEVKTSLVTYAKCVVVNKDDKELGRGREVFTTTSAEILYDPATGKVFRVPTKDAIVNIVDTLEPSVPAQVTGPDKSLEPKKTP